MILVIGVLIQTVCASVPAAEVKVIVFVAFTVTVAVIIGANPHPLAFNGVMVKVTVTGEAVIFVKVPLILPMPLAAMPVTATVLFLVQL